MNSDSLRELKKEIHALDDVSKIAEKFHENWVKPLRTSKQMPFLAKLPEDSKNKIKEKLSLVHKNLAEIKHSQVINQKLQHYARYLIDLKLTSLNGDSKKSELITKMLLEDDFLRMKNTIVDIQSFETNLQELSAAYHDVNALLEKNLSLDEALFLMELPHKMYLHNLLKTSQKQKQLVRDLGRHFISLAKKTVLHNGK